MVEWVGFYDGKILVTFLDGDTVSFLLGEEFPFPYNGSTLKG